MCKILYVYLYAVIYVLVIIINNYCQFVFEFLVRFSTGDQGFPLCAHQTEPGVDGCKHVGYYETVFLPMMAFYVWQILYFLIVSYLYTYKDI